MQRVDGLLVFRGRCWWSHPYTEIGFDLLSLLFDPYRVQFNPYGVWPDAVQVDVQRPHRSSRFALYGTHQNGPQRPVRSRQTHTHRRL